MLGVAATGTDTYVVAPTPAPDALVDGMEVHVRFTNANTGAATLNVTGSGGALGAKAIKKNGATALVAGDIPASHEGVLRYFASTTVWVLMNPAVPALADAANGGVTIGGTPSAPTIALNPADLTAKATPVLADSVVINDVAGGNVRKSATLTSVMALAIFSKSFTSTGQTITAAGALTIAHGLGVKPFGIGVRLVCGTGEQGYTAGQEVEVGADIDSTSNRGVSIIADATNLTIRFGSNANSFNILHATNGTGQAITNANWTAVFRAWV